MATADKRAAQQERCVGRAYQILLATSPNAFEPAFIELNTIIWRGKCSPRHTSHFGPSNIELKPSLRF
jgi:hypothetical protein